MAVSRGMPEARRKQLETLIAAHRARGGNSIQTVPAPGTKEEDINKRRAQLESVITAYQSRKERSRKETLSSSSSTVEKLSASPISHPSVPVTEHPPVSFAPLHTQPKIIPARDTHKKEKVTAVKAASVLEAAVTSAGANPALGGKEMSDEKAARLAAIRAANAAKNKGNASAAEAATSEPESSKPAAAGKSMSDDKAARLAAIRAANQTKQTDESTTTQSESSRVAAAGKSMSDDKAARLAAIRAANQPKGDASVSVSPTPSPATAAKPAAAKPTTAAKPAAAKPAAPVDTSTPSSNPATFKGDVMRVFVGAIIGAIMVTLFGLMVTSYIALWTASAFGAIFGGMSGLLVGRWPPLPGEETTE